MRLSKPIQIVPQFLHEIMRRDDLRAIALGLIVPPKKQTRAQRILKRVS